MTKREMLKIIKELKTEVKFWQKRLKKVKTKKKIIYDDEVYDDLGNFMD